MKKKVLLMAIIGLVLFGAVLGAALNAIFTVTDVRVRFHVLSREGETEAMALQSALEEKFVGKSTTFLDLDDVYAAVGEYPAFRVDEAKKDFPRALVLTVSERRETFAFLRDNGMYAVLDEEGLFLYDRETNSNRRKGENVLLEGFPILADIPGAPASGEYVEEAIVFASVFAEQLDDVRANLLSVSLVPTENPIQGEYYFRLQMREGVAVNIYTPKNLTEDKARAVLTTYLGLDDTQRLYGMFDVIDDLLEGGFRVSRHREDAPAGF